MFLVIKMAKTALIIASNGSEEMELLITSDVLRRAGVEVFYFKIIFFLF